MMSSGAIPIHATRMEKPWDFDSCLSAWLQEVQVACCWVISSGSTMCRRHGAGMLTATNAKCVACRWCLSEPASDSGLIVPVGFPESGFEVSFFMADDAVAQHYPDQR